MQDEDIVPLTFNLPVDLSTTDLSAAVSAGDSAAVHLQRVQHESSSRLPSSTSKQRAESGSEPEADGHPDAYPGANVDATAALASWVKLRGHFLQVRLCDEHVTAEHPVSAGRHKSNVATEIYT